MRINQELQTELDSFLRQTGIELGLTVREMVPDIVSDSLKRKSDQELNYIVRSKIDEDLTYIRINGVIVGALIGAILFAGIQMFEYCWR